MRVTLNLASRPYVELGPLYTRLRTLAAALALIALPLWVFLRSEAHHAAVAQARLDAVENKIQALEQQHQGFQAEMREPRNAKILSQSQFLNQLFARKTFSWTAVMMDLENVLPAGVQVENIDPVIARNGQVTIRLRVSGQHDRAVDLVRNLEHSRRFLSPRLADEAAENSQSGRGFQPVSAVTGVNFDIVAEYNPLPERGEARGEARRRPAAASKRKPAAQHAPGRASAAASGAASARATGAAAHNHRKAGPP